MSINNGIFEAANAALLSRRAMLNRMCTGFGMMSLAGLLGRSAFGSVPTDIRASARIQPRAKRAIFLFLNGGPSHVDTFDPKPALKKYEGEQPDGKLYKKSSGTGFMPSPFAFQKHGQSGIDVSETLPHLASIIDDCCIIR